MGMLVFVETDRRLSKIIRKKYGNIRDVYDKKSSICTYLGHISDFNEYDLSS